MDHRHRVSLIIGLITAALLRKYLLADVFNSTGVNENFFQLLEPVFDIFTTVAMMLTVYMLYPFFIKAKK